MPAITLSTPYAQSFDSLALTPVGVDLPWNNDSTLPGWYASRSVYRVGTGSSNAGALYSFGSADSAERALGSVASGSTGTIFYGARFINDTSAPVTTLTVRYTGEQWRNGGNTTPQALDFAYRIGGSDLTSGAWVDVNSLDFTGPVASSTPGALNGNDTANRVAITGNLSGLTLAPGEELWLRWADADDASFDHGLAIDDVSVTIGDLPPAAGVTLIESNGSTSVSEQDETTDTYTLALNTVPSGAVTIRIVADESQVQISQDGVNFFAALDLTFTDTTPATITVRAVNDTVIEGSHTSILTHTVTSSADPAYASLSLPSVTVTIADNDVSLPITKIHSIQGSGNSFDPAFGGIQTIEGIVVGDFQIAGATPFLRGFYVQEEDSDADSNPLTSEGIFVFDNAFGTDVQIGDKVRITGEVNEFTSTAGGRTSSLTQLRNLTEVVNLGSGNPLPTAAVLQFPLTGNLEAVEGMRVTVPEPLVVTEHFELGRFGQVVLAANGPSNQPGTDARLDQYTQFNAPSVSGFSAYLAQLAQRRLILDDGQTVQNPDPILLGRGGNPLSASNTLRGGDTVTNLTGVLDERFGDYRVQPVAPVDFQPSNPRPATLNLGGTLRVAGFNLLNYFNGDGLGGGFPTARGAESLAEFNRQRAKTIAAILGMNSDVVGLIELENDGYGPNSAIQDLVNGLNAAAGAGTYALIDPGTPNLGSDQIAVGFIYKPSRVTPVGAAATVPDGFGQGAFDADNRKPLAQTFRQTDTGAEFTAVINHFKSKGSSAGKPGDEDAGDGQGLSNGTRLRAAQDLAAWLATNPTGTSDPDYLLLGDLNAYALEDPIRALENAGYQNLVSNTSYSFVFNGQWGSLDHALANGSLAGQIAGATKWHINADEPNVLDYNTNFKSANQQSSLYSPDPFRSSDHDPVVVGLNLTTPTNQTNPINGTPRRDTLIGTAGDDIITGFQQEDRLTGNAGNDQFVYVSLRDGRDIITDFTVGQDQIVLRPLLQSLGLSLDFASAVNGGYLSLRNRAEGALVFFDADGAAGPARGTALALVRGVSIAALNTAANFGF
ncbi:MAG: ExeM/NucH family extracellular endonuclease [Synechococcales cyanobacterium C42_A2020_086]|jgi:predicted extracellular nuclease|nr:ExeM/NucH family extracellular endonuclease [Synechococcales cyanobacterium C42_A2020_086]